MAEIKPLEFKASINTDTTPAELGQWDAQTKVIKNTGIERDGGVTNLYTQVESNSQYDKTFYTRNNKRVRLLYDALNNAFIVYSNDYEVGRVPPWAVEKREKLTIDANDVMATVDDTFLALRLSSSIAKIQEVDSDFVLIRERTFAIPSTISDGFLVRNKAPTWANVTSIVGVYTNATKLNHEIITDSGVVYTFTGQAGFVNAAQVFAYYENGWIVCANDKTDGRTFLLNSAGVQQGSYTEAVFIVANYNQGTGAVTFEGVRDVITLGTAGTYGNSFTPPAAPLGVWVITALTNGLATPVDQVFTFGGYELCYGSGTKGVFFANNTGSNRTWTIGHSTPSEIYGYLDAGASVAFKVHTILGDAAYMSMSFNQDGIGVPITEIGELNPFYYPQILRCLTSCYKVIYRRGDGSYGSVTLTTDVNFSRMQEIAPGVVKINTNSALCIVDANDNDLQFGGNAYNGFVIMGFDAVAPAQKAFVSRYRGEYGGSVDTNYKSTGAVLVGSANLTVIPEGISYSPNNETIDVFYGPPPASLTYYRSIKDGFAQMVKTNLLGTIYVDDLVVPPPAGAVYFDQTIALIGVTVIKEPNYDGYQLLNEAPGSFISFTLFGNLYLFDGDWIYIVQLSANVIQSTSKVANGLGLVFLAESPTTIYFYSGFDNSIYIFDGGQAVSKQSRFSQKGPIRAAKFSPYENTLAVFLDNSVIFNRDGIMTESFLPIMWPYDIFETSDGIWIAQNKYAIKYVYSTITGGSGLVFITIALDLEGGIWGTAYADYYDGGTWGTIYTDTIDGAPWGGGSGGSGVIDPLIWQSQYLGFNDKIKQSIDRFTFRVYKQDKVQTEIAFEYYAYHENGDISEISVVTIGDATNPYDENGYAFIEYIPANKNAIASSIKLTCEAKIVLVNGFVEITTPNVSVTKNRK